MAMPNALTRAAPARAWLALALTCSAAGSAVLVGIAPSTSPPLPATTPFVLAAAVAVAAVLLRAVHTLSTGGGWTSLRHLLGAITVVTVGYPGLWSAAAIASTRTPYSAPTWALAALAGVAHLPLIATFSLVPLLTVRYLGRGSGRTGVVVVASLGVAAVLSFVLFFGDFEPLAAEALVRSALGERIGMGLNLAFLSTVLLGPLTALVATWRSDGTATRRLALVAGSSLAGTALVMVCGAVGTGSPLGQGLLLIGMYAALALAVTGCTAALTANLDTGVHARNDRPAGIPTDAPSEGPGRARVGTLTARESEVLQLLAEGLSNAGIAARLVLSERTVDAHLRSVFAKLDLPQSPEHNRRVHAVNAWQRSVDHPRSATHHVEQRG